MYIKPTSKNKEKLENKIKVFKIKSSVNTEIDN